MTDPEELTQPSHVSSRFGAVVGLLSLISVVGCSGGEDATSGAGAAGTSAGAGGAPIGGQGGAGSAAGGTSGAGAASGSGQSGAGSAGVAGVGAVGGVAGGGGAGGVAGSGGAGASGGASGSSGAGAGGASSGAGGLAGTAGATAGSGGVAGGGARGGGAGSGGAGKGGDGGQGGSAGATTGPITVWLAGDSTVANGNTPCPVGWGKSFDALFDDRVTVVNSAVGGRSVRTWLYNVGTTMDSTGECVLEKDGMGNPTLQSRWQAMLDGMKAGDYLLIQFGINDGDTSCDRHVGIEAFKSTYGVMAAAAKERGTQPVFITPVSAVACNGTMARATRGAYVTATEDAGTTYDVPVIDLHQLSIDLYTARGFCPIPGGDVSASTTGPVGDFFCDDHTHFSASGAPGIAALVAGAVRDQSLGLAAYLK